MYIYKIIIKNFRNIESLEWNPNKKINVLFGHNGCGKSNVAQALNLLFSTSKKGDYFELSDYYQKNEENKIVIQAWLNEIDDLEIEDKDRAIQYITKDDQIVNEDTNLQDCKEMLIVQLTNDNDKRMLWSLVTNTEEIKFNLYARKNINYSFVSTQRSPTKELSFGYQTLLQEIIKEEIDEELKEISNEAIELINNKLEKSEIIKTFLEKSLKIDEEINGADKYKIIAKEFIGNKAYNNLELGITKENYNLPLESQSTGIQNLLLLSLMKKKLEGRGIVFIEELEQNLEPKNQIITDVTKRAKTDQSIKGIKTMNVKNPEKAKKIADEIIKNTYRTLMTRGQKGCYIYCTNKNLSNYLKRRLNQNNTTMYQFDIEENTTNIMVAEDNETYKYK